MEGNEHYVSNDLKIGFNDILIRCNLLCATTLKRISSRIDTYYLAKDTEYLISQYGYEISRLKTELVKAKALETNLSDLIANYDGNTQTIILPGGDPAQVIEIDTYYNQLMDSLLNQQRLIIDLESEIGRYEKLVQRYKGEDPNTSSTRTNGNGRRNCWKRTSKPRLRPCARSSTTRTSSSTSTTRCWSAKSSDR